MVEGPLGAQQEVVDAAASCLTVDAGAGTGKTTTMLLRIEHLLESGVDPADILVLTFANEAASSIREAIADRLDPATAAAIDVYTYHSLCYHLVRDHAYYLGHSPHLEVVTDAQRRRIVERLLATGEYDFASEAASGAEIVDEVEQFIARLSRDNIEAETLLDRLPDQETIGVLSELTLLLERRANELFSFDNEAFRFFNRGSHLADVEAALITYGQFVTYCREELTAAPVDPTDPVVADVDRYLGLIQECITATRERIDLESAMTKHLPRVLFGNQIGGAATETVEQTPIGRITHYVAYLRVARHYAGIYADYRETIRAEGAVDFDELVREATSLLSDETVADSIRDEWAWVCCDEFQDTDATQFELLTALAQGGAGPNLLAIGDTDQAIYGWRGTDPAGLRTLGEQFDDHESFSLEHNFRSAQAILDVANETSYGPQASKRLREAPTDAERSGEGTRVLSVDTERLEDSTPELVARSIESLLGGTLADVPQRDAGDVAVIVRTNRQAAEISTALREARLPHTVTGSPTVGLTPGIQTVISLFRVLVDPSADEHLRRILMVRYRLHEDDLERLHATPETLNRALKSIDPADCRDPARIERVKADLHHLRSIQDSMPLSRFVEELFETTSIGWFLETRERETLDRIVQFVEARQSETVLTGLDEPLVDALERALAGGRSLDRGSRSADRIDVMTVHQAKGLEFDTVLAPFLSDRHWCVDHDHPARSRHELLSATLDPTVDSPLCTDLATESVREEWRVFHVAITRAANHLLLFGAEYAYDPPEALGVTAVEDCLPDAIEWGAAGARMDLWSTLGTGLERVADSHPQAVADVTDDLAAPGADREPTIAGPTGTAMTVDEAIGAVHRLGWLLRNDLLLPAADAASAGHEVGAVPGQRHLEALTDDTVRFPVDSIVAAEQSQATVRHSHSALATHERCPRRHYLDHVVFATADPTEGGAADGRVVGSLFHDIAEECFYRGFTAPGEWQAVAQRHLTARDLEAHTDAVLACVDRYFQAEWPALDEPVHAWEALAAELRFTLEAVESVEGPVVGYVDSIRRLPDGRCAVLDYKATADRIDPSEAGQLTLYAEACRRRYDLSVDLVGYVYVGAAGPGVDLFDPSSVPDWRHLRESLATLESPRFDAYQSGPHCATCPHTSLGCAPDSIVEDR